MPGVPGGARFCLPLSRGQRLRAGQVVYPLHSLIAECTHKLLWLARQRQQQLNYSTNRLGIEWLLLRFNWRRNSPPVTVWRLQEVNKIDYGRTSSRRNIWPARARANQMPQYASGRLVGRIACSRAWRSGLTASSRVIEGRAARQTDRQPASRPAGPCNWMTRGSCYSQVHNPLALSVICSMSSR